MSGAFIFKYSVRGVFFGWLILSGLICPSFAGTLVKTFDFGAGGDNPTFRSQARAFAVPRSVAVAVTINYRTAGAASVALVVEVESANDRTLAARETIAEQTMRRIVINIPASENTAGGCEKAWQVRVGTRDAQIPAARVFGDIVFSFIDPPASPVAVENGKFDLGKGGEASRPVGEADSFGQTGIARVRASWTHDPAVASIPLKFELVRPDGSVAASAVGYGTNSVGVPKLDFGYVLKPADARQNGVWKIRISNQSAHDVSEIIPQITFRPACGN